MHAELRADLQFKNMTATASMLALVQEDASLFDDSELLHIYKGTYTAEYEACQTGQSWKLASSTITL